MIPDLLLALASVAVLLSPVVVDAGLQFELRKDARQGRAMLGKGGAFLKLERSGCCGELVRLA